MASRGLIEKAIKYFLSGPGYDKSFLNKLRILSAEKGKCELELTVEPDFQNRVGSLHGGCTATLVDTISTLALMTDPKIEFPGVSVDMHITYLKAAKVGEDIVIKAWTNKVGKRLAYLGVDIIDKKTGSLLAQGSHTKFIG